MSEAVTMHDDDPKGERVAVEMDANGRIDPKDAVKVMNFGMKDLIKQTNGKIDLLVDCANKKIDEATQKGFRSGLLAAALTFFVIALAVKVLQ